MSLDKVFEGPAAAAPMDPHRMRAEFPDMWAGYLRAHYRNAEAVAVAFGVTFQTACNWLSGVSRPTGDKVMIEALSHSGRLLDYAAKRLGAAA